MASKKITDLQLIDAVTDDVMFATDDGIQSYRVSAPQITEYILPPGVITVTELATDAVETAKIKDANVTYAKIQNVSATARVLGRSSTGAGVIEEISLTAGLGISAGVLGLTPASQSEMEAGSSIIVPVTPGRVGFHPGVAKAWARWNGTGTIAIDDSYNVASLTDNGTGDTTITFTTSFSSANYAAVFGSNRQTASNIDGTITIVSLATGSCRAKSGTGGGTAEDHSIQTFVAFGDQ